MQSTTRILLLLIVAAALAALLALVRVRRSADAAEASQRDLAECVRDISEMAGQAGGGGLKAANAQDPEFHRQLRAAAAVAGTPDELVSIEGGPTRRVRDTDYNETLLFLRLNSVTLVQLGSFLRELSARDASIHTRAIELAVPAASAQAGASVKKQQSGEPWTADITLAQLFRGVGERSGG